MKDKKIITAVQQAVINDLYNFENASETRNSLEFSNMVRETASMYRSIISEDLRESAQNAFDRTPPGLLIRYSSELSREIADRISKPENVKKLMRNMGPFPEDMVSKRHANLISTIIRAIGSTLE